MGEKNALVLNDKGESQNPGISNDRLQTARSERPAPGFGTVGSCDLPKLTIDNNAKLTGREFGELAKAAFSQLDVNHDGRLSKDELKHELDHPAIGDSAKTLQAIKLMYDKYDFLKQLSLTGKEITYSALDEVQKFSTGELDSKHTTMSYTGRDVGLGAGIWAGTFVGGVPGYIGGVVGGIAVNEALALGAPFVVPLAIGGAAGLAGIAAIAAVGYGIGYGVDYLHRSRDQKRFEDFSRELAPSAVAETSGGLG